MPNLTPVGVQAVVAGLPKFEADMGKMKLSVKDLNKDMRSWAQEQVKGATQGAAAAGALVKKYEALAAAARQRGIAELAAGRVASAQKWADQGAQLDRVAEQYRRAAGSVDEMSKSTMNLSKLSQGLQANWAALAGAAGILVGFGRAVSGMVDMGRAGAAATQTAQSFDILLNRLGISTTLLDDLRVAARGTITDVDMMSSVLMLAAGGSAELTKKMIEATPALLEIAKAASKLNPSLGDTTYLFDSLARGIKRGSPLILDNLGIIVSIGDANAKYAAQLGVATDSLNEEQKSVALLNAVLEQGGNIIQQAGGTTEAATDQIDQMNVALAETKQTLQEAAAPAVSRFAVGLTGLIKGLQTSRAAVRQHAQDIVFTSKTYDEYVTELMRVNGLFGQWVPQLDEATWKGMNLAQSLSDDRREVIELTMVTTALTSEQATNAYQMATLTGTINGQRAAADALAASFESINVNLANTVAQMQTDIAFMAAGGLELQAAADAVKQAFLAGAITPEEADAMLNEIGIAALEIQSDIGAMKPAAAVKQAVEDFGATWGDAQKIINDTKTSIQNIPRHILIEIEIKKTGSLGIAGGFQHGGKFVVGGRAGVDTNLVAFRATRGEVVTVTPPSQVSNTYNRSIRTGDINISDGRSAQEFDSQMRDWLGG